MIQKRIDSPYMLFVCAWAEENWSDGCGAQVNVTLAGVISNVPVKANQV
jgi:hypothetical protein